MSYSVVTDQPQYREYIKKYPGEEDTTSNMRNRRDYFYESFYNRYKKGFPQSTMELQTIEKEPMLTPHMLQQNKLIKIEDWGSATQIPSSQMPSVLMNSMINRPQS